jgi:glycosyltransferase involved in cell wall biosynthesis
VELLAISEHGTRTGGPVAFRSLLRWISEHRPWRTTALFGSGGQVFDDVGAFAERVVLDSIGWRRADRWAGGLSARAGRVVESWHGASLRRRVGPHDLVFVNSVAAGRLATPFLAARAPVIVYVHELGDMFAALRDAASPLLLRGDHFIAASEGVRSMLVEQLGVARTLVTTVSPTPEREALAPRKPNEIETVRARHGLAASRFVVGAFGWVGSTKGTDRFVEVARRIVEGLPRNTTPHFLWIGGATDPRRAELTASVKQAGLEGVLELVAPTDEIHPYYRACDVVLVTSREESLSLVALEAAAAARPVLCFNDCSGPMELSRTNVTTPCADEEAMARLVLELMVHGHRRAQLGERGALAVREHHHPDRGPAAVAEVIERVGNRQ